MTTRQQFQWLAFAIAPIFFCPLANWLSVTRVGTSMLLWGEGFFALAFFVAIIAVPYHLFRLFFQQHRKSSLFFLLICSLLLITLPSGLFLGQAIRTAGMRSFAMRSQSLVSAIKQYEIANSNPPTSLQALVPKYLPQVPSTGMGAYPSYDYHVGDQTAQRYEGNAWVLEVDTLNGGGFDSMLYFPNQYYPKRGYGGRLQRIGDWAYVHE